MSLREAQSTLIELANALADWQRRLSELKATIPDPRFEDETDQPMNAAAKMVGTIESILLEEIPAIEQAARTAAGAATETHNPPEVRT